MADQTVVRRVIDVAQVRDELDAFEQRYGHASSELAEAFRDVDGALDETEDFFRWSQVYAAWRAAVGRTG